MNLIKKISLLRKKTPTKKVRALKKDDIKFLISGLSAFLNVPILYSKGFLASISLIFFLDINLSHFLGDKYFLLKKFLKLIFSLIGTTSSFILTLFFEYGNILELILF